VQVFFEKNEEKMKIIFRNLKIRVIAILFLWIRNFNPPPPVSDGTGPFTKGESKPLPASSFSNPPDPLHQGGVSLYFVLRSAFSFLRSPASGLRFS